ncbi:MAG TPA: SCO family protein [Gaiellaceae bacterium]|jgi:cytochrome oxidase Cu insertion factor (SCO1/SenC/PrrC family)|nr:SCO family protein [Gaiellaceae bacterium]
MRLRFVFWGVALAVGIGVGAAIKLTRSHAAVETGPAATVQTWAAGAQRAPGFSLVDQSGKAFSLASLKGRPVIVTFIDPLCRDFCPREASILSAATDQLSGAQKPAIVSVSVDPWADNAQSFHQDALHWKLAPGWLWGTGTHANLASVWKHYYVDVLVTQKKIAGVSVRYITHTGAAYLIDSSGYERALFLYPFTTSDVVDAARNLTSQ